MKEINEHISNKKRVRVDLISTGTPFLVSIEQLSQQLIHIIPSVHAHLLLIPFLCLRYD